MISFFISNIVITQRVYGASDAYCVCRDDITWG